MKMRYRHLSSSQIILLGFLLVIAVGTLLLMLPFATQDGKGAVLTDAMFTATSCVCVTGLVVQNTATYWSGFGQAVLLSLIQIGGLGVVTIAVAIAMFAGRKIGLMQRSTMQEAIAAPKVSGIVKLTSFILKTVFIIELLGAMVMYPVFAETFGYLRGVWYAVFHSVSAFCNAGFDIMGTVEPYSSLTYYASNEVINITIMLLIIIGGIGFLTWDDIKTNGIHLRKYRMQSKVIFTVTSALILLPAAFFFFVEFSGGEWSDISIKERILYSFFQAVTPRTAGFNTVDLTALSEPGVVITIILMLIGGSPGSTAGGMKTTTVAVLVVMALSVFKREDDANIYNRRIATETLRQAAAILLMYTTLFIAGGLLISCIEEIPVLTAFFETASAIGTVGLSLGVTPELGLLSRIVLIILMILGRVGGLTLIFATWSFGRNKVSRLPQEKITVG